MVCLYAIVCSTHSFSTYFSVYLFYYIEDTIIFMISMLIRHPAMAGYHELTKYSCLTIISYAVLWYDIWFPVVFV